MIVKKEFLERLKKEFNLNIYEVKIWTALLTRGISTAGELADISGVPRSRCYDVLESLEKKSFIVMKIGKPIKYIAVQPSEVIERVKKGVDYEAQRNLIMIESIRETDLFDELKLLHKSGIEHFDSADLSSSIRGRADINFTIKTMIRKAKKSVTITTTSDSVRKHVNLLKTLIPEMKKKKIKLNIIGPNDSEVLNRLDGFGKYSVKNSGLRFINVDKEELFFMTSNEGMDAENETGIWLKSPYFISTFSRMFDGNLK